MRWSNMHARFAEKPDDVTKYKSLIVEWLLRRSKYYYG